MNEITKDNMNLSIGSRLLVHFRHLKKIFRNEEQETKKSIEINLQNLEEWLDEKSKPLMEEVRQQTEEILMRVNDELQKSMINVKILENAKLQNPNIPFKAKQYMEGNRQAYIRSINSFLGHMEINNKDYFYLEDFCKTFDDLMNNLNKSTLRSYTILQEFFSNETGKIANNLNSFDKLFSELKSALKNEKLVSINKAREKVQNLKSKKKQKINLDVELRGMEATLKLANEEKATMIQEIEKFSKSEELNNFLSLVEKKKSKTTAYYEDQNIIMQSFSTLERTLRKYSHVAFEHEEIVLDYINNPIETLANDKSLSILDVIKNLEKLLRENQLQIDEKKKERSMEEIKKLNKEFLKEFLKKYYAFKEEIEDLDQKIKRTGVAEKFKELNKQLDEINIKIEKNNEEFNKLKNDSEKLNLAIANLTNNIENDLRGIFNEEIKIGV